MIKTERYSLQPPIPNSVSPMENSYTLKGNALVIGLHFFERKKRKGSSGAPLILYARRGTIRDGQCPDM